MYASETFGRMFWIDDDYEFRSCPLNVDGTGDFDVEDYVSEWCDWEGVDYNKLFNIHKFCILNKINYAGSITHREAPVVDTFTEDNYNDKVDTLVDKMGMTMNTYDENLYREIVKDSKFSYGKFTNPDYPLHLQQH
jgi:hypothetical protein